MSQNKKVSKSKKTHKKHPVLVGGSIEDSKVLSVVSNVFGEPTECAFTNTERAPVCSPNNIVHKMKEFIQANGKQAPNEPVKIVSTMKDMLNCKSESCLLRRKDFVEFAKGVNLEQVLEQFFKPEGPALNFGLLSNFNIDDVLDQFAQRFADRGFLHIPFQMRDFEKVGSQLATVDLAYEFGQNGKRCFGVVLNTDWSTGRGVHWFCLFGENHPDKVVLEYFNSSGKEPLPEVQAWLQKTKHYLHKTMNKPVEIYYSTGIRFQDDDHSCGVYCLCYIWLRLEKVPPQWFRADNFNDKHMHHARKNLFRHER
jgi:hypothetical protein